MIKKNQNLQISSLVNLKRNATAIGKQSLKKRIKLSTNDFKVIHWLWKLLGMNVFYLLFAQTHKNKIYWRNWTDLIISPETLFSVIFFSAGNWMLVLTNSAVLNTTFTKTEETNNFVSERRDFGKNLKTIIENNWRFIEKEIEDFENIVFWGCRWESDGIVYVLDLKYYNTTLHVVFTWALGVQEKQSWMNLSTIFIEKHW